MADAPPDAETADAIGRSADRNSIRGTRRGSAGIAGLHDVLGNVAGGIRNAAGATGAVAQRAVAIGQEFSRNVVDVALTKEPVDDVNFLAADLDDVFSWDRETRAARRQAKAPEVLPPPLTSQPLPRPAPIPKKGRLGDSRHLPGDPSLSPPPSGSRAGGTASAGRQIELPNFSSEDNKGTAPLLEERQRSGSAEHTYAMPAGIGANHQKGDSGGSGGGGGRRGNALADEDDEEELMIGEVRTIRMKKELRALYLYMRQSLVLVVPCLFVHLLNILGGVNSNYQIADVSILWWSMFVAAALLTLPFLRFGFRLFAYSAMRYGSKLLYRSNLLYFTVALHYDVALVCWAAFLVVGWRHILLKYIDLGGGKLSMSTEIVDKTLKSWLTFCVGWLIKNFAVMLIATQYLWRPYLKRVQSNIFAQYALLMLTDFVTCGKLDKDDERFALQFSNPHMKWEKLSLYAVSKAIGFIPAHKLGRQFSKTLMDRNATEEESAAEAEVLGNFLFDQLALISCHKHPLFNRPTMLEESLSRITALMDAGSHQSSLRVPSKAIQPQEASEGSTDEAAKPGLEEESAHKPAFQTDGSAAAAARDKSSKARSEEAEVLKQVKTIDRRHFCPAMNPTLARKAFAMFDTDGNGVTTREEMALGVEQTFRDHKSLALTLQDSQHIAIKLGQLIGGVIFLGVFLICLWLFGLSVKAIAAMIATFLVAFAKLTGSISANLLTSIIYIFVMRVYDVGDRVIIYDSNGDECNCVVTQINLLTTVFKRWDERMMYVPNTNLSTSCGTNIQRSGHQWHEFFIHVNYNDTTITQFTTLRSKLEAFAKSHDHPKGLYSYMIFSLTDVDGYPRHEYKAVGAAAKAAGAFAEDSNKMNVRICFRSRGNFQDFPRYWGQHSMCMEAIKQACEDSHIELLFPEVPSKPLQQTEVFAQMMMQEPGGGCGGGGGGGVFGEPALAGMVGTDAFGTFALPAV